MAVELFKNQNGVKFIKGINFIDLMRIIDNNHPICDSCLNSLIGVEDIVLYPLLNEVYCPKCAEKKIKEEKLHYEDYTFQNRRTKYYAHMLIRDF